jgi:hypothetical protein
VLLPPPLGPTSANVSPGRKSKSNPRRTSRSGRPGYAKRTSRNEIAPFGRDFVYDVTSSDASDDDESDDDDDDARLVKSLASIRLRAPVSTSCGAPSTRAALSAACIPLCTSALSSLRPASAPATSSASGTTVVSSPTVSRPRSTSCPPYHSHAATAVEGTAAKSARCAACA